MAKQTGIPYSNGVLQEGWSWDPPKRGEKMPDDIRTDLENYLYQAYEFHVPSMSRKPKNTVMRHGRALLERVHLDSNMDKLSWAISEALMCNEYPYPPPKYKMWKHDFSVMEGLVIMLKERMDLSGPVHYSLVDSQEMFRVMWNGLKP